MHLSNTDTLLTLQQASEPITVNSVMPRTNHVGRMLMPDDGRIAKLVQTCIQNGVTSEAYPNSDLDTLALTLFFYAMTV